MASNPARFKLSPPIAASLGITKGAGEGGFCPYAVPAASSYRGSGNHPGGEDELILRAEGSIFGFSSLSR